MKSSPTMKVAMKGKLMFNKSLYVRRLTVINHIGKTIICIFNIRVFRRYEVSANASYHGLSYDKSCNNASVNLTLYDDKFGLQGYYYSKT